MSDRRPTGRTGLLGGLVAGLVIVVLAVGLARTVSEGSGPAYDPDSLATRTFEDRTGVRLVRVALAGGGGHVDLRYQVLDPTKAAEALSRRAPLLVDESSGLRLDASWMAHVPHPVLRTGVSNYVLLLNSPATAIIAGHVQGVGGHVLRSGSAVTVVIGGARLEHVPVQ